MRDRGTSCRPRRAAAARGSAASVTVDARQIERPAAPLALGDIARHPRRLAEQHVEVHVDGRVAEMRIVDDAARSPFVALPTTANGQRSRSQIARNRGRSSGANREHVALLRLVAPDLARRHARLFGRDRAQIELRAPRRRRATSSGSAFDNPPAPTSWIDRIGLASRKLPAAVDHLLRAALDLGVAALHRIEIEIGGVRAGGHRRRGAAAHADQHARAAELDQQRTGSESDALCAVARDVAHAAGDHDRLVIAAHLAGDRLLERAEIAEEVRPAELVVERRAADRTFEHDVRGRTRCAPACRRAPPTAAATPGMRRCDTVNPVSPAFGFAPRPGRALVANLAAGARRRARKRRDRGRMIVRLDLHQDVRRLVCAAVAAGGIRIEARAPSRLR